jgi:hypothetical protein
MLLQVAVVLIKWCSRGGKVKGKKIKSEKLKVKSKYNGTDNFYGFIGKIFNLDDSKCGKFYSTLIYTIEANIQAQ